MLRQIAYVSQAASVPSESVLLSLLRDARGRNQAASVTGMLLYHDLAFMQVIEGPADAVEEIFTSIREDPRHQRIRVLFDEPIDRRDFTDWWMGFHMLEETAEPVEGLSDFLIRPGGFDGMTAAALSHRLLMEFRAA